MEKQLMTLCVNGETHQVAASPTHTLLEVLREELDLTGTKHGCELGHCGACTVLMDGEPVLSCLQLAVEAQDQAITTIEGLAQGNTLHPLQWAFAERGAAQCGYCTPGFLLSGAALLARNTTPSRDDIKAALAGNLCRCTGYTKIIDAVELASERLRAAGGLPEST
jgi:carbon-monoxide dehydrogenase small subunit